MRINTALLALSVGAFAIGITEFSPMGMLPYIAENLNESIPSVGAIVVIYALGVMIGAPIMTLLLVSKRPKVALVFLMAIFTVGNLLSGLAPNLVTLSLSRLITSLNHGAFFGLGAIVAASVVPAGKQASAIAAMFMGLTIAGIGGVPLVTKITQLIGWREAFYLISGIGLLTIASLIFAIPARLQGSQVNVKNELRILKRPLVMLGMLSTVLGASAMFTLYTFITPMLMNFIQASDQTITMMLMVIGLGFSIGNYLGGYFADKNLYPTLLTLFVLSAISMVMFPIIATNIAGATVGLLFWSIVSFALVPPIQILVMNAAVGAQALASSVNIGAFNLGNAIGAAVGAAILSHGYSYTTMSFMGALLAIVGFIVILLIVRRKNSETQTQDVMCSAN
ncbi:MFS transporter [Providencia sp. PROV188]|uniref:MFS transporter n=1 Tax=Providencia TaxID=586 RepID=UPI0003E22123|nr:MULTISPECIES: MFS transporter [Providencia]ETT03391.1 transporter, major facilitator family protein [Providencia alcalifaciens PAL-3]EUD00932.1 transporter, major facilitator family protein [Providencia alcalifaciens PAL-1]MTB44109.1 MFS transporter [Providencia sp. wls1950]MTC41316.1 MFS transporter [Providencia sp. wls1921]MTC45346.1 MFS transporter [Providencia sp. wls1922]